MIGIAKLKSAAQAAHYYEKDDYYMKSDQLAPSQWSGAAAETLGLAGEVDRGDFANALQGSLPGGVELPRNDDGQRDVGIDLSFNAPKSVSLVALVSGDERLLAAHREAVERSLAYLEDNAAVARVTRMGQTDHEATGNLLVAQFHHDTSRELDPHLHTHAVVLNATQRADGEWRALTNSAFYDLRHTADTIYRTELASRVQALGYEVERTRADGQFELAGFSRDDLMRFSKRREAIEAALDARGETGAAAAQRAALMTRASKREVDRGELRKVWQAEVAAYQVRMPEPDADRARAAREAARDRGGNAAAGEGKAVATPAAREAVAYALEHLGERAAVIAERDILKHALQASVGRVERADEVFAAMAELKSARGLLSVDPDRRRGHDLDRYWTTPKALGAEHRLLELVERGQEAVPAILSAAGFDYELDKRGLRDDANGTPPLTKGQTAALEVALTSSDRFVGVQGYAGTGKTTALENLRQIAEQEGFVVRGFAPSAAAAQQLQSEAGIESETLAQLLLTGPGEAKLRWPDRDAQKARAEALGEAPPVEVSAGAPPREKMTLPGADPELEAAPLEGEVARPKRELWVVDEASMVGNSTAYRLLRLAETRGARVVLVGDKDQLPSIEAGRAFRLMAERGLQHVEMTEVLRQRDPELKAAVYDAIERKPEASLEHLGARVLSISSRTERLQAVANAYVDEGAERAKTLVLTPSNADRIELNARIRQGLRRDGALQGEDRPAEVLVGRGLTKAQLQRADSFREGEVVRFGRDYKTLGVHKGETFRVAAVDADKNLVTLKSEAGGRTLQWQPHRHARVEAYGVERRQLAEGDRIRWTRNDKGAGRRNGEYAEVLKLAPFRNTATVRLANGDTQVLDLERERHWDHGYAVTAHAAQGQTRNRVLVHVDTSQRQLTGMEQWYVSISRAKSDLVIYTDDADNLPRSISRSMQQESALDSRDRKQRSWDFQRQLDGFG